MTQLTPSKPMLQAFLIAVIFLLPGVSLTKIVKNNPDVETTFKETKTACNNGDMAKCNDLGDMYTEGTGVKKNEKKAFAAYKKSCDGGDMLGCKNLGNAYATGAGVVKDEKRAVELYHKSCEGGRVGMCGFLGGLYYSGSGVTKDFERAKVLFQKACAGGNMRGCFNLGVVYNVGAGVSKDSKHAVVLFEESCDGGYTNGCEAAAVTYTQGVDVEKDDSKAMRLYRKGCDGGSAESCYMLGEMYKDGTGTATNEKRAAKFYQKACDGGEMGGCYRLAHAYEIGAGVKTNVDGAFKLYQKACDGGHMRSCTALGISYSEGDLIPKDINKAISYYDRSCASGEYYACHNLGVLYDNGEEVEEDDAKAAKLYEQACTAGFPLSCNALGKIYYWGEGVEKDLSKAAHFYNMACEGGIARGCRNYGQQLVVKGDLALATVVVGKGCELGDVDSCSSWGLLASGIPSTIRNPERVLTLIQTACRGGDGGACLALGRMHEYGALVAVSPDTAASFYKKACDEKIAGGCQFLGELYLKGEGVEKNEETAAEYLLMSCDAGEASACELLVTGLSKGGALSKYIVKAREIYSRDCSEGSVVDCVSLGQLLLKGTGGPQDVQRAMNIFKTACESNYIVGCYALLEGHEENPEQFPVSKETGEKLLKFFEQGCSGGRPDYCEALGRFYREGKFVEKDYAEANRLFDMACQRGDMPGCRNLGYLHQNGLGVSRDPRKAASLFRKACDAGEWAACTNLAVLFYDGEQVNLDEQKANALYEKACENGELAACNNLGRIMMGSARHEDKQRGVQFVRRACNHGMMDACFGMALAYRYGQGVEKDAQRTTKYVRKACDGGSLAACGDQCYLLAHKGLRLKASECFESISEKGDWSGNYDLKCEYILQRGYLAGAIGNFNEAKRLFDTAIAFANQRGIPRCYVGALIGNGASYLEMGDFSSAELSFMDALERSHGLGLEWVPVNVYARLGFSLMEQTHYKESLVMLEKAFSASKHLKEINSPQFSEANYYFIQIGIFEAQHFIGNIVSDSKIMDVSKWLRQQQDQKVFAALSDVLGRISLREGRFREALVHFENAVSAFDKLKTRKALMQTTYHIGEALEALGRLEDALVAYDRAVSLAEYMLEHAGDEGAQKKFRDHLFEIYEAPIRLRSDRIRTLERKGDNAAAATERRETFSILEKGRARVMTNRMAQMGVRQNGTIPRKLTEEEDELANRITALQRLVSGQTESAMISGDFDKQHMRIEATEEDYAELKSLYKKRQSFAEKLWSNPKTVAYAALHYPRPVAPEDIGLRDNEVLVEFMVGEQGVYRWILHDNALVAFDELKISPEALGQEVNGLLAFVKNGNRPQQAAHSVYKLLIEDAMKFMPKENGRLIVVPDGVLATLPFEYLNQSAGSGANDEKPLGLDYPVVYAPSARAIELARRGITGNVDNYDKKLLAVGDPVYLPGTDARCGVKLDSSDRNYCPWTNKSVYRSLVKESRKLGLFHGSKKLAIRFDDEMQQEGALQSAKSRAGDNNGFDRLCHTRNEVLEISQTFDESSSDVLLDFAPTKTRVMELIGENNYETIHFSTHGVMPEANDNSRYAQPAIVLAAVPAKERDTEDNKYMDKLVTDEQLLTMKDIFESRIPAKQVTLSACHSGQGEQIKGEGVQGMGQAFLYAGAQTVVMSLWSVNDASTAEWMKVYYTAIENGKDRAAAALEARKAIHAKKSFENSWNRPYYWAPFIVVGVEK